MKRSRPGTLDVVILRYLDSKPQWPWKLGGKSLKTSENTKSHFSLCHGIAPSRSGVPSRRGLVVVSSDEACRQTWCCGYRATARRNLFRRSELVA